MPEFYDALETRDPESRERALMGALPRQIAHAKGKAPGWARILAEVDPAAVTGRAALARLPVTRKSDLGVLQKADPPFGGLNATPLAQLGRIFVSPGPVYDPVGRGGDWGRAALGARGIRVLQSYASADLGLIAYESEALEGMILDEELILEIVRPGTGDPVPEGEVGEVVITTFNADYPLIRFGTGDLSAVLPGISPCGRTNMRIRGWMGRADQTTKVKGMFVHPSQVAEIVKRHAEILKARLVVDNPGGSDRMTLQCEVRGAPPAGLAQAIEDSIRSITKLRGEVAFRKPGGLPNNGKAVEDAKKYD